MAVAGCGVAAFVLISRRNVVANSGSHAGVSAISNSLVKKAGIIALAATLALTSAFSFSKAFAGGSLGGGEVKFNLDSNGYQIYDWETNVTLNDQGKVTDIEMYYWTTPEKSMSPAWADPSQGAEPIKINSDSLKWVFSLFNDDAQNDWLSGHPAFNEDGTIMYPTQSITWNDIEESLPGENYSLRSDLLENCNANGGSSELSFDIPFERQTKFDVTFDYGYEGSTPYVTTIDWADINLKRSSSINIPVPSRDGYEFLGWNEYQTGPDEYAYYNCADSLEIGNLFLGYGQRAIKGYWKQVDSTNDIDANTDQTDSEDSDLNADVADADTQNAVSEQNSDETAQGNENNADLVDSSDFDASAVKED